MDPNDQQQSGGINQPVTGGQTGQVPDQPYGGAPVQEPFQTPVAPETPASQPAAPAVSPEPVGQVPTREPVSQPTGEVLPEEGQPTQPTENQPAGGDSNPPQTA